MRCAILKKFLRDTRGNILILTGIGFLFLMAIGGAGYDLGHQQLVRQKIQQAADASALAAATMPAGTSAGARQSTANGFFELNYPASYLGILRPTPRITVGTSTVKVEAGAPVPTSFVGNIGVQTLQANGASTVGIIANANKIDMVLVMDNSGSMHENDVGTANSLESTLTLNQKLNNCRNILGDSAQRTYFKAFFDIYDGPRGNGGSGDLRPFCRFPYVASAGEYSFADNNGHPVPMNFGFFGANGINALRYSADHMAADLLNANGEDHRVALVTWNNNVINANNFSRNYNSVHDVLMQMIAAGDTNSTEGLLRADQFSSSFRNDAVHVIVLLTDGVNQYLNTPAAVINASSLTVCDRLKARPQTLIYTIAFRTDAANVASVRQFLSDCASGPHGPSLPNENQFFFRAPDADALEDAFDSIVASARRVQILE